jgi:hypothetical protein
VYPESASSVSSGDRRRVQRAIEHARSSHVGYKTELQEALARSVKQVH